MKSEGDQKTHRLFELGDDQRRDEALANLHWLFRLVFQVVSTEWLLNLTTFHNVEKDVK